MRAPREPYLMNVNFAAIVRDFCLTFWVLVSWAAPAQARTVAVVHPQSTDPVLVETVARVHGELLAVGLRVQAVERSAPWVEAEARAWILELQQRERLDAVISVSEHDRPPHVDVWVFESTVREPHVTRVSLEASTENAPEKLAIRAIDVLRSTFLELDMQSQSRNASTQPELEPERALELERTEPPKGGERSPMLGVSMGVATLTGVNGVGPAIMPMARVDVAVNPAWTLQAAAAGLGTRPSVDAAPYSAQVEQVYATFGARYRFYTVQDWHPFVALGAGILSTSVEGRAALPAHAQNDNLRSLLLEASLGADWRPFDDYFFCLASHVHWAAPSANVVIVDSVAATTGQPNLALTLSFGAWL